MRRLLLGLVLGLLLGAGAIATAQLIGTQIVSLQALPPGSASSPTIAFNNGASTGIYSTGVGAIDLSILGTNEYRWTLNGYTIGGTSYLYNGIRTFAQLSAEQNGAMIYCSDCTIANPCAAAGTGALAKRLNAVWVCN